MDLKEVLNKRRSVRKFKDTMPSDTVIQDILDAGMLAPETDSCHYYFGVIRDHEVKHQIAEATHYANWVAEAPVIMVCCADISWDLRDQSDDSYGVVGFQKRYGEDLTMILREHPDRKACKKIMLATPVYIAAQQMILTAVSHGLRGCLVDFIDLERINKILGLPEHITCQLLLPIGYPDEEPKPIEERRDKKTVFYDRW